MQLEKKYRDKETGKDKSGRIWKKRIKEFLEAKEIEDDLSQAGLNDFQGKRSGKY